MENKKIFITTVIVMCLILMVQVIITSHSWKESDRVKGYAEKIIIKNDSLKLINDSISKANKDLVYVASNIVNHYDSLKHRSDSLFDEMWVLSMEKQKYEMTFTIFAKYYPESAQKFAYIMTHRIR